MASTPLDLRSVREVRRPAEGKVLLSWSAPEYEQYQYKPAWFVLLGGAALVLVILGILSRNYFFIAFIVLASAVLFMYAKRAPRTIEVEITGSGVKIGKTVYPFTELKSFWIFNLPGAKELSLDTKKAFSASVRAPLGDMVPEKVKRVMAQLLPEEEHQVLMTDQIARKLGL